MNIELILAHIAQYEQAIEAGDLDIDTVQMLSKLYQKGIEYFSALDDTMFGDLLNRMQSLLQREDIQVVLNSLEEQSSPTSVKRGGSEPKQESQPPEPSSSLIDFNVTSSDLEKLKAEKEASSDEDLDDFLKQQKEEQSKKMESPEPKPDTDPSIKTAEPTFAIDDESD